MALLVAIMLATPKLPIPPIGWTRPTPGHGAAEELGHPAAGDLSGDRSAESDAAGPVIPERRSSTAGLLAAPGAGLVAAKECERPAAGRSGRGSAGAARRAGTASGLLAGPDAWGPR